MLGKTQLDNADQFFTERSLSVVSHSNGTILLEKKCPFTHLIRIHQWKNGIHPWKNRPISIPDLLVSLAFFFVTLHIYRNVCPWDMHFLHQYYPHSPFSTINTQIDMPFVHCTSQDCFSFEAVSFHHCQYSPQFSPSSIWSFSLSIYLASPPVMPLSVSTACWKWPPPLLDIWIELAFWGLSNKKPRTWYWQIKSRWHYFCFVLSSIKSWKT